MGIGGAPEGVLAAAALKCLGGDMQARLIPYTDEERKRCWEMGIDDINRVMTLDDLVKGDDCIFSATAITDTPMMRGVQYFGGGAAPCPSSCATRAARSASSTRSTASTRKPNGVFICKSRSSQAAVSRQLLAVSSQSSAVSVPLVG